MSDQQEPPPPPSSWEAQLPTDASYQPAACVPAVLQFPPNGQLVIGKASFVHPQHHHRYLLVGRQASTCDIRISHKSLSRQHAVLYYSSFDRNSNRSSSKTTDKQAQTQAQTVLWVMDLGGKAGTLVNEIRIAANQPQVLHHGDSIQWAKAQPVFTVQWEYEGHQLQLQLQQRNNTNKEDMATNKDDNDNDNDPPTRTMVDPSLTGRAKRQAEIAAMMASLDEAPTYSKFVEEPKPPSNVAVVAEGTNATANGTVYEKRQQKAVAMRDKHQLPFTDSTNLAVLDESTTTISSLAMDPTGARFAIGSMDSSLRLYDFGGLNADHPTPFTNVYVQEGYPIRSLSYSPTGDRCIVGTGSAQPRIVDRDGQEIVVLVRGDVYVTDPQKTTGHTAEVTSVAWHPLEKSVFFTTSRDGSVKAWNIDNGKRAFSMLKCHDTILIKNLQTGRKTIPTCLIVTPKHVIVGTDCGSLQWYSHPFVSKLRPYQSVLVVEEEEDASFVFSSSIQCLVSSMDTTRIACRTARGVYVYDAASTRLVKSCTPLWVCPTTETIGTIDPHDGNGTPTMAFSPNGKVICIGVHEKHYQPSNNDMDSTASAITRLDVYAIPKDVATAAAKTKKFASPIYSCQLDRADPMVGLLWHTKLNQLVVTTTKTFQVWYSVAHSTKGVLLTAGRRRKRKAEDDLQEMYQSRAPPPGSTVRYEQILAPNALPMFGGETAKQRKQKKRDEEDSRQHPQQPAKSVYNTNNTIFAQLVVDNGTVDQKIIAGKDPREALAKYSEGKSYISAAYEGNTERILADKTVEEEEDEMKKK